MTKKTSSSNIIAHTPESDITIFFRNPPPRREISKTKSASNPPFPIVLFLYQKKSKASATPPAVQQPTVVTPTAASARDIQGINRLRNERASMRKRPGWWGPLSEGSHRCMLKLRPADALKGDGSVPGKALWCSRQQHSRQSFRPRSHSSPANLFSPCLLTYLNCSPYLPPGCNLGVICCHKRFI